MGVLCPCGVIVKARSNQNNVKFNCQNGTIKGDLIYTANVCVTTLETSTLSLQFIDTETPYANNFTFSANAITDIQCKKEGQDCKVTVTGTGTVNVNTRVYHFTAVFRDVVGQAAIDQVQQFTIVGLFDQNGTATVTQGSIVAVGCQEV